MREIMKVIKERRSTRAFKPSQIPMDTVKQILEAGTWAPSGMGKQGWHFVAVQNVDKIQNLAKAVGKADNRGADYNFYGAPSFIIISNPRDDDNGLLDAGAATQNMLLMAQALGVGSCWINQVRHTCDVPEVRAILKELGVPDDHIVTTCIALGYIAKETPAKPRHDDLITIVE